MFALAAALAARLDAVSSASHQIALNIASVVFMVPLGLASAGAVRVGHAVGARDIHRARRAGWTALVLGGVVMSVLGLMLFLFPVPMLRAFTTDARVIDIGTHLLAIAAAFQLFDGTQAVATGVLRGLGDTRTPMIVNVIGTGSWGCWLICSLLQYGQGRRPLARPVPDLRLRIVPLIAWIQRTRHDSCRPTRARAGGDAVIIDPRQRRALPFFSPQFFTLARQRDPFRRNRETLPPQRRRA